MLGLPDGVSACLFDLDGRLTDTAKAPGKAWKQMFAGPEQAFDGAGVVVTDLAELLQGPGDTR